MTSVSRFFTLLLPLMLVGCSYITTPSVIKNRDKHYLTARSIPPLKIPPGISSSAFENAYPVSDRYYPENAKYVSLTPPGLMDQ
jgi:uncharacterized lipoprotein